MTVSPWEVVTDLEPSSESTEFWRDRWLFGTARNPCVRSIALAATGLDTLCGLVGRLSLLSKDGAVWSCGLPFGLLSEFPVLWEE